MLSNIELVTIELRILKETTSIKTIFKHLLLFTIDIQLTEFSEKKNFFFGGH